MKKWAEKSVLGQTISTNAALTKATGFDYSVRMHCTSCDKCAAGGNGGRATGWRAYGYYDRRTGSVRVEYPPATAHGDFKRKFKGGCTHATKEALRTHLRHNPGADMADLQRVVKAHRKTCTLDAANTGATLHFAIFLDINDVANVYIAEQRLELDMICLFLRK